MTDDTVSLQHVAHCRHTAYNLCSSNKFTACGVDTYQHAHDFINSWLSKLSPTYTMLPHNHSYCVTLRYDLYYKVLTTVFLTIITFNQPFLRKESHNFWKIKQHRFCALKTFGRLVAETLLIVHLNCIVHTYIHAEVFKLAVIGHLTEEAI